MGMRFPILEYQRKGFCLTLGILLGCIAPSLYIGSLWGSRSGGQPLLSLRANSAGIDSAGKDMYVPADYSTGVIYRTGAPTVEGYGSFFQQYKGSIVTAMYLRKTIIFLQDDVPSEHGYSISPQVNKVHFDSRPGVPANYSEGHCEMDQGSLGGNMEPAVLALMCLKMSPKRFKDAVEAFKLMGKVNDKLMGNVDDTAHIEQWFRILEDFEARFANCTDIHSFGENVNSRQEAFNDCVQPWLSYTLQGMYRNRGYKVKTPLALDGCLDVGVHIRWGDVAPGDKDPSHLDWRNMRMGEIQEAVRHVQQSGRCLRFHVFAKNATAGLLAQIPVEHTYVDRADDLLDMFEYGQMDVYIQGDSTYVVMATLAVSPGKVIITNQPSHPKYDSTFRDIHHVYHYTDLAFVDHIRSL